VPGRLGRGDTGGSGRARAGSGAGGGPGGRGPHDEPSGYSIPLTEIIDRLGLMRVAGGHLDLEPIRITTSEVNRPGLQLTGYLEAFSSDRLQIIGWIETAYLSSLEPAIRSKRLDDYFALGFPALIVARGLHVMPDMVAAADRHDVPVFVTGMETSPFASALTWLLIHALAPRREIEAGLVDVHGEGVLILGDARLGKSETILELVRRGHRLIADDLVEVRRISGDHLRGRALPDSGFVISIPGVGSVDVEELFGIGSIRSDGRITVVVVLESRDPDKEYERVGITEQVQEVFGVPLARVLIPVQPGRNLAVIIEAVALTHRQRVLGYVAAAELTGRG
jgi:HPr kinase/phosphorylase